jgi:hypothetical protein
MSSRENCTEPDSLTERKGNLPDRSNQIDVPSQNTFDPYAVKPAEPNRRTTTAWRAFGEIRRTSIPKDFRPIAILIWTGAAICLAGGVGATWSVSQDSAVERPRRTLRP